MINFTDTKEATNTAEINKIEEDLNLKFPAQYVEHIRKYNGGYCTPNVFEFNEHGEITHSSVNWFFAIYEGKSNNLRKYISIFKKDHKRLPQHMVPIACDPGGNMICISCGPKDNGYIYFWDHENEVDYTVSNDEDYANLFLIAKSFNEFLEGLMDYHK